MKSNASNFIIGQQMAALMLYKLGYFLQLSWWQVSVLRDFVAVACEMEACTEHSSPHCKQSALIEFMLLIESLRFELTAECRLFMVTTELM
jgi:hypothetical protein